MRRRHAPSTGILSGPTAASSSVYNAVIEIHLSHEAGNKLIARIIEDLYRPPRLFQASLVDDQYPVRNKEGLLLIVGHENRCQVHFIVEPAEPTAEFLAYFGVHCPEKVHREARGAVVSQGTGQGHPLALSPGELIGHPFVKPFQSDEFEQAADRFLCSFFGTPRTRRPNATFSATVMFRNNA